MTPRAFRLSVNRAAKLLFGGSDGISGRILNLSKSGARVYIWGSSWVPHGFELLDVFSGTKRKSRVIWRSPDAMACASSIRPRGRTRSPSLRRSSAAARNLRRLRSNVRPVPP